MNAEVVKPQTPEIGNKNFDFSPLAQEVSRLRSEASNSQSEWYLLPGTGFNVKSQVDQLRRDLRDGFETGKRKDEIVDTWLQKTEEDIKGFELEYLMQGLVLPIVLDRKIVNGRERIVGSKYGGKPLVDMITEQERQGSVKRSVAKIENFLLKAPPGSTAVMTSPDGWSGTSAIDDKGLRKEITYQDSQTYVFKVLEDGRPMGFTLRTDMNVDQNKKLLRSLGSEEVLDGEDEKETVTNIVDNPVFNIRRSFDFSDVASQIQKIKGSDDAHKGRSFSEIYIALANPERLWRIDDTTKMLVDEFKQFVKMELSNITSDSIQRLEMALGITILKLSKAMRTGKEKPQHRLNVSVPSFKVEHFSYARELEEVQKLPGCNGGGNKNSIITGSISPRFGEKQEWFSCPKCGYQADGPVGDTCPKSKGGCGLTKEAYASEEAVIICD